MPHSAPTPSAAQAGPSRRGFFGVLTWLLGGLAAVLFAIPVVAYLFGPLLRKKVPQEVSLGSVRNFPRGQTRWATFDNPLRTPWDGMTADTGVYVRRLEEDKDGKPDFWVFAVNCAHLGCPVTWFPQSGLFMCPCHGGVYYENGERASGPPPRGMFKCVWRIEGGWLDDRLVIQAPHFPTLQNTERPEPDEPA